MDLPWYTIFYNYTFVFQRAYICSMCGHTTENRVSMKRHIMAEINYKPWRCPHCPYRDVQAGGVKRHCAVKHKVKNEFGFLKQDEELEKKLQTIMDGTTRQCKC